VPDERYWAGCDVVVLRPGAQRVTFHVRLSLPELYEGRNDWLFREVTAYVPFAEWDRVEIFRKVIVIRENVDDVRGRRSVHSYGRWPYVRNSLLPPEEQEIEASEGVAGHNF
jgi:hypothetical protein